MTNRIILSIALLALLGVSAPVAAQTTFSANLSGDQEAPPSGSTASGSAALQLNAAGTALAYTIQLNGLDLDGTQTLDPNDDVVAMHFHNAPAGSNGGVVFGLISPGHDPDDLVINPAAGTLSGVWEETDAGGSLLSTQLASLAAGNLYLNVHTPLNPGGEIRGQIFAVQPAANVPVFGWQGISVLILLLAGIGVGLLRRTL